MTGINLGNGYTLDFAEAEKFVHALKEQKSRLNATLISSRSAAPEPPGADEHSDSYDARAKYVIKKHAEWNLGKQDELQNLIDKITAAVHNYRQTEHDNTMGH